MDFNPFGTTLILLGLCFVVLPAVILGKAALQWFRTRTWRPWQARVDELELRTTEAGHERDTKVLAHYRYRTEDGREYDGSGTLHKRRIDLDDPEGRSIDILLHPRDPGRSMVHTDIGGRLTCMSLVLLPCVFAGILTLVGGLRSLL